MEKPCTAPEERAYNTASMTRARGLLFVFPLALAGCIIVVQAPPATLTPAAPILVATQPPSPTPAPTLTALIAPTLQNPPSALSTSTPLLTDTPLPSSAVTPFPASTPISPSIPISIVSFVASPAEIRPGEIAMLTWEVIAAEAVIWQLDSSGRLSVSYTVPISGTLAVTAPAELRNHVDFILFAYSGQSSAQAFVSVKIGCLDVWFFPNPPADCPASPPHYTAMQAEHFERGLMLWTEWNRLIYILYTDNLSPRWDARPDAWEEGMPLDDPAFAPPSGYSQPVRGFGLAWRDEQAPAGARAGERLGWATDEEFAVSSAAFQCDSQPKYSRCYITGPNNVVYALEPERAGWFVWTGPTPAP